MDTFTEMKRILFFLTVVSGFVWLMLYHDGVGLKTKRAKLIIPIRHIAYSISTITSNLSNKASYFSECPMKKNVVFLKVHKCGSSTVANIMYRFTLDNDLNPVLPNKPIKNNVWWWYLGYLRANHTTQILPIPPGQSYNTFFVHSFYNRSKFQQLFPNDTFYFSIIREPIDRFVSYSFYFKKVTRPPAGTKNSPFIFSAPLSMHNVFKSLDKFEPAADFGLNVSGKYNSTQIDKFIQSIDNDFDFVMILEYFDESLVYLRRALCWSVKDILYITLNKNRKKTKTRYALSSQDIQQIKSLHVIDVTLYNYFYRRFWQKLKNQSVDFFEEVSSFKEILKMVSNHCRYRNFQPSILVVPGTPWSSQFSVTHEDCAKMLTMESYFVQELNLKMKAKFNMYKNDMRKNS